MKTFVFDARTFAAAVLVVLASLTWGCGATSSLTGPDGQPATLKQYPRIVVLSLSPEPADPIKKPEVTEGCGLFTTKLVEALKAERVAAEIGHDDQNVAGALVISGAVTRYEKGDAGARLMWGCGAGSSYLDATLAFKDGDMGSEVGHMTVNRNSWWLGGIIASSQSVESFAEDAAKKVASELTRAMQAGSPPQVGSAR